MNMLYNACCLRWYVKQVQTTLRWRSILQTQHFKFEPIWGRAYYLSVTGTHNNESLLLHSRRRNIFWRAGDKPSSSGMTGGLKSGFPPPNLNNNWMMAMIRHMTGWTTLRLVEGRILDLVQTFYYHIKKFLSFTCISRLFSSKLRAIKGAVSLYVNAGYKLRFLLWPYYVTRRMSRIFQPKTC